MKYSLLEVVEFSCRGHFIGEEPSYVQSISCQSVKYPIHSGNQSDLHPRINTFLSAWDSHVVCVRVSMTILNLELLEMISILSFFDIWINILKPGFEHYIFNIGHLRSLERDADWRCVLFDWAMFEFGYRSSRVPFNFISRRERLRDIIFSLHFNVLIKGYQTSSLQSPVFKTLVST